MYEVTQPCDKRVRIVTLKANTALLKYRIVKFDENQPRDERGRWSKIGRGLAIAGGALLTAAAGAAYISHRFIQGYKQEVYNTAAEFGIRPSDIIFSLKKEKVDNAGVYGDLMGQVNPDKGTMTLFPRNIRLSLVKSMTAHEATHLAEMSFLKDNPNWEDWINKNLRALSAEGGVGPYSKSIWAWSTGGFSSIRPEIKAGKQRHAVKETLAEMSESDKNYSSAGDLTRTLYDAMKSHAKQRAAQRGL